MYYSEKSFRIPASLDTEGSKKRKRQKDVPEKETQLIPISQFCENACKPCLYVLCNILKCDLQR